VLSRAAFRQPHLIDLDVKKGARPTSSGSLIVHDSAG
jgi:hypothetical protein